MKNILPLSILLLLLSSSALAQHSHDGAVGEFYQTWERPDNTAYSRGRNGSCCNKTDCRPVVAMRRASGGRATWEVRLREPDGRLSDWYRVPDVIWEDQQDDPRESPDGHAHACVRYGAVICAVRGGDG
jgi:hypothetical protein